MKLLAALKNGWGFKKYLSRLFWSRGDYDIGRSTLNKQGIAKFIDFYDE
jgi:hypothetical protein